MLAVLLLLLCCIDIFVIDSVDIDQMLYSAVSCLGLHCLPITFCLEFAD